MSWLKLGDVNGVDIPFNIHRYMCVIQKGQPKQSYLRLPMDMFHGETIPMDMFCEKVPQEGEVSGMFLETSVPPAAASYLFCLYQV